MNSKSNEQTPTTTATTTTTDQQNSNNKKSNGGMLTKVSLSGDARGRAETDPQPTGPGAAQEVASLENHVSWAGDVDPAAGDSPSATSANSRLPQGAGAAAPLTPQGYADSLKDLSPPQRLWRVAQCLRESPDSATRTRICATIGDKKKTSGAKNKKRSKSSRVTPPSLEISTSGRRLNGNGNAYRTAATSATSQRSAMGKRANSPGTAAGHPRVVVQAQSICSHTLDAPRINSRVIAMNDIVWARERQTRGGVSPCPLQAEAATGPELVPQLRLALADHYLAALMHGPHKEADRIVAAFVKSPEACAEVMRYLRAMYGGSCQKKRFYIQPQHQHEEPRGNTVSRPWVPAASIRSLEGRCPYEGTRGWFPPHSHELRHFIKAYAREVSLVFLEEACALGVARRDQAMADQPPEAHTRCTALSDEVIQMQCEQVVALLLQDMLSWTEKTAARVRGPVARRVRLGLPPYRWDKAPSQARTPSPSLPRAPESVDA